MFKQWLTLLFLIFLPAVPLPSAGESLLLGSYLAVLPPLASNVLSFLLLHGLASFFISLNS